MKAVNLQSFCEMNQCQLFHFFTCISPKVQKFLHDLLMTHYTLVNTFGLSVYMPRSSLHHDIVWRARSKRPHSPDAPGLQEFLGKPHTRCFGPTATVCHLVYNHKNAENATDQDNPTHRILVQLPDPTKATKRERGYRSVGSPGGIRRLIIALDSTGNMTYSKLHALPL